MMDEAAREILVVLSDNPDLNIPSLEEKWLATGTMMRPKTLVFHGVLY